MALISRNYWISGISLFVSVMALVAVGLQTMLQWRGQFFPIQASTLTLQLEACSKVIGSLLRYSNNNAGLRLAIASMNGGDATGIHIYPKVDLYKSMSRVELEKIIQQKETLAGDYAIDANIVLISSMHLFSRKTRQTLLDVNGMLVEMLTEPEGNNRVKPSDLTAGIETFRKYCGTLNDQFLADEE